MKFTIQEVSETEKELIAPRKANVLDPLLNILAKKEYGEAILIKAKLDTVITTLLNSAAQRQGFSVSRKKVRDGVLLTKKPIRVGNLERSKQIHARRISGETLETIGKSLNLTRERIRQLDNQWMYFNKIPRKGGTSVKAINEFIAPYLAFVKEPICLYCKNTLAEDKRRMLGVCVPCRTLLTARMNAASRLRSYIKSGMLDAHNLAEAMVLIRKYRLQPEDLF